MNSERERAFGFAFIFIDYYDNMILPVDAIQWMFFMLQPLTLAYVIFCWIKSEYIRFYYQQELILRWISICTVFRQDQSHFIIRSIYRILVVRLSVCLSGQLFFIRLIFRFLVLYQIISTEFNGWKSFEWLSFIKYTQRHRLR